MITRRRTARLTVLAATAAASLGLLAGCGAAEPGPAPEEAPVAAEAADPSDASDAGGEAAATPSEVLASTPWETTGAVDENGAEVPLEDEAVAMFVGYASFAPDGTFTMFDLQDAPKMQGDWAVDAEGSTRSIVAKDDAGAVLFERDSEIITLTPEEFTYRVYPDPANTADYYDIVHTPTDHAEPGA